MWITNTLKEEQRAAERQALINAKRHEVNTYKYI